MSDSNPCDHARAADPVGVIYTSLESNTQHTPQASELQLRRSAHVVGNPPAKKATPFGSEVVAAIYARLFDSLCRHVGIVIGQFYKVHEVRRDFDIADDNLGVSFKATASALAIRTDESS